MQKLYNYNKNETLATGFTKPKISSLFFDKIWLPKSLTSISHEFFDISNDVLVREESELRIQSNTIKTGDYYNLCSHRNVAISSGEYYEYMLHSNSMQPEDSFNYIASKNLIDENIQTMKKLENHLFKYSKNRNHAIFNL